MFEMSVDLNVLDHLARGLYTSVAAILTEAVANSWDADASEVRITLDVNNDTIVIADNGEGMNVEQMNARYLHVGYRRRKDGREMTPGGRSAMGRKGIGKLSLMSIADQIVVTTRVAKQKPIAASILVDDLRKAMEAKDVTYKPKALQNPKLKEPSGTRIELSRLVTRRLRDMSPESTRRRLARRFTVIGSKDFKVWVNNQEITPTDRMAENVLQHHWPIGQFESKTLKGTGHPSLPARNESWDPSWKLTGWLGTADKPRSLNTSEGNLNSIVLVSRGRLVQEDILPSVSNAELFAKYITGSIEAEFLDVTEDEDIVTSNRQSLVEDDVRVRAVVAHIRTLVRKIGEQWSDLRTDSGRTSALAEYPKLTGWIDQLPGSWQHKAKKLIGQVASTELVATDSADEEAQRHVLMRHAVMGFERLRLRNEDPSVIVKAMEESGAMGVLKALEARDALESSLYMDIVANRLDVIKRLESLVDQNHLEKVIQEYLFDHLWLLSPSWDRATSNSKLEERLQLVPEFADANDKYGRIDIRYRTAAGRHIIIELKRPSVNTSIYALAEQGAKYVRALQKLLPQGQQHDIVVVFTVGKAPDVPPHTMRSLMDSISPGSQVVTYDQLIADAASSYEAFRTAAKSTDVIDAMFS